MCFRDIFYQSTSPSLKGKILFSGLEFIIYITSVIFTQLPRTPTWISHKIIFPTRDIMNPRPATISQTQERLWAPHKLQLFYPQNMTSEERQQRFHTDDVYHPNMGIINLNFRHTFELHTPPREEYATRRYVWNSV